MWESSKKSMQQLPETEVAGKSAEKYKLRYTIMQMQEDYARNITVATIQKMYVLCVKNVTAATSQLLTV